MRPTEIKSADAKPPRETMSRVFTTLRHGLIMPALSRLIPTLPHSPDGATRRVSGRAARVGGRRRS